MTHDELINALDRLVAEQREAVIKLIEALCEDTQAPDGNE